MNKIRIVAAVACAFAATAFAGPFDQFKGKMKPGMYEYKMEMEIPGMPAGMGKQAPMTFQQCLTQQHIDEGGFGKQSGKSKESCEVKNMNVSGNTATYSLDCKDPKMKADNRITFADNGFKMDMQMAMDQGGQTMNMTQKMERRYLGPCK